MGCLSSPFSLQRQRPFSVEPRGRLGVGTDNGQVGDHAGDKNAEHHRHRAAAQPEAAVGAAFAHPSAIEAPSGRVITYANQNANTPLPPTYRKPIAGIVITNANTSVEEK